MKKKSEMYQRLVSAVSDELIAFDEGYRKELDSQCKLLTSSSEFVLTNSGKRLRPVFTFLTAKALGDTTRNTVQSAILIELLHTATLLHDDVVDDTRLRRGKPSLNAVKHNKVAVLVGDYFLSTSLTMAIATGDARIYATVASVGRLLSEGELIQVEAEDECRYDFHRYKEIIYRKTASLFEASAKIGAITAGATDDEVHRAKEIGRLLGMAFQIKDDIFDYFPNNELGKPTGNDLREGKVTLPLLFALSKLTPQEAAPYESIIRSTSVTQADIQQCITLAVQQGGIEYAEREMMRYLTEAKALIDEYRSSEYRDSLHLLADYVAQRSY